VTTEAEWAWVAGVIEGEGCFQICKRPARKSQDAAVTVLMTDEDVIRRLQELSGVGRVTGPHIRGVNKPIWLWRVAKADEAIPLITAIRPWLLARRAARADEVVAILATKKPRSYRQTVAEKKAKRLLRDRRYVESNRPKRNEYMKLWMRNKRALLRQPSSSPSP
jgi:hypothetical protein